MTAFPTWDTLCAFYALLMGHRVSFDDADIFTNVLNLPEGREVEDLDFVLRYHNAEINEMSGTATPVKDHELSDIAGMQDLLHMLALNNGMVPNQKVRGGYLKTNFPKSFPWLIREVWEIPMPGKSNHEKLLYWLRAFLQVVDTYFSFYRLQQMVSGRFLPKTLLRTEFPEIAEELGYSDDLLVNPEALFTLPGYLTALCCIGQKEFVEKEFKSWQKAFASAHRLEKRSKARAEEIFIQLLAASNKHHFFETQFGTGAFVQTDNKKVATHIWRLFTRNSIKKSLKNLPEDMKAHEEALTRMIKFPPVIMVIRRRSGQVTIQSSNFRKLDFTLLSERLTESEPELWFLETRYPSHQLLNGSQKIAQDPSTIKNEDLLDLVRRSVRLKPRVETPYDFDRTVSVSR